MIEEIGKLFKDIALHGLEKMGLFYSKYRGFVYRRDDPDGYSRLMLYVPDVFGDMVLDKWVWPANNFSGPGYGAQAIPQVNDVVWVEFELGNPKKPIWSYGHFGKGEKPEDLKDPNLYWFRTPNGLQLLMDDNSLITKITTPNGFSIEINEETETIQILTAENYQIKMDADGIHLDGEVVYLNGDSLGGAVIAAETQKKLNNLESEVNTLKTLLSTWVPVPTDGGASLKAFVATWAGQTLTPTTEEEISNQNVQHG